MRHIERKTPGAPRATTLPNPKPNRVVNPLAGMMAAAEMTEARLGKTGSADVRLSGLTKEEFVKRYSQTKP